MLPSTDYSYLGSGSMLIRKYGDPAPFLSVGNVSALSFSPQEEVKQILDYTAPGGNKRNEVRRLTGVDMSYTFHDFSAENFARGLRSDASTIAAGTATAETVVAYKGGYAPMAKIASSITTVTGASGTPTYVAGTDYELRDGQLFIPSTSTVTDPVAGAANLKVTYAYLAQKKIEALVNSNVQYEVVFVGLNEAQSGKRVRIRAHKVSAGVIAQMAVIGEDFGAGEVSGALLSDGTKTGAQISKFMTVELED
jgi:hypothetical protein